MYFVFVYLELISSVLLRPCPRTQCADTHFLFPMFVALVVQAAPPTPVRNVSATRFRSEPLDAPGATANQAHIFNLGSEAAACTL